MLAYRKNPQDLHNFSSLTIVNRQRLSNIIVISISKLLKNQKMWNGDRYLSSKLTKKITIIAPMLTSTTKIATIPNCIPNQYQIPNIKQYQIIPNIPIPNNTKYRTIPNNTKYTNTKQYQNFQHTKRLHNVKLCVKLKQCCHIVSIKKCPGIFKISPNKPQKFFIEIIHF